MKLATWTESTQASVTATLGRVQRALSQNPGYQVVYEFPNLDAAIAARKLIEASEFANVVTVRVRKP